MQPENLRFGGGTSETVLHPIVLVAMLIAMALIFLLPRRHVIWPFLITVFLLHLGQSILVGGLHFFVIRIIILTVAVRMLATMLTSPEGIFGNRLGVFDIVFLLWAFFRAFAGALVFSFNTGAVVYQAGFLLDAIGGFFLFPFFFVLEGDSFLSICIFLTIFFFIVWCMLFVNVDAWKVFVLLLVVCH